MVTGWRVLLSVLTCEGALRAAVLVVSYPDVLVGAEEYCGCSNTLARMATVSVGRAAVAVHIICGRLGSARASYIYECGVPVEFDLSTLRMHFPVRK